MLSKLPANIPAAEPMTPIAADHPLQPITLEPPAGANACVIWLHGLGADGNDFVPFAQQLRLLERGLRFVFPQAPVSPVTINGGMATRSWYDILSLEFGSHEDDAGIRASSTAIGELIQQQVDSGIAEHRIVLAGFSQGGAVTLHTGLRHQPRLGGLIALSTYLPLAASVAAEFQADNIGLPVFYGHGRHDPLIPIALAEQSRDRISEAGVDVEWHSYPVEHGIDLDELADIQRWLLRVLTL